MPHITSNGCSRVSFINCIAQNFFEDSEVLQPEKKSKSSINAVSKGFAILKYVIQNGFSATLKVPNRVHHKSLNYKSETKLSTGEC